MKTHFRRLLASFTAFLLQAAIFSPALSAKIEESRSLSSDDSRFFKLSPKAWVVFDLDSTVFQTAQALGHDEWLEDEVDRRRRAGASYEKAAQEAYDEWLKIQEITAVKVVESSVPELINRLQKKDITVMALTHRPFSSEEITLKQLSDVRVDFSLTAPAIRRGRSDKVTLHASEPAYYRKGILFAHGLNNRVDVFAQLVRKVKEKEKPKAILMVSSRRNTLEKLESWCRRKSIDFTGIHYTAAQNGKARVYDRELAKIQQESRTRLLSNEEARLLQEKREASSPSSLEQIKEKKGSWEYDRALDDVMKARQKQQEEPYKKMKQEEEQLLATEQEKLKERQAK